MSESIPGSAAAPTAPQARIESLDVVRGFALLGILLVNIIHMGQPFDFANPAAAGPPSAPDLWTWIVTQTLVEGAMRTLFSMLFGAGFLLLLERIEGRGLGLDGVEIYMRRVLLLAAFGVFDVVALLWMGDILIVYALAAPLLLIFRRSSIRILTIACVAAFAATTLVAMVESAGVGEREAAWRAAVAADAAGETLSPDQEAAKATWENTYGSWSPDDDAIAEKLALRESGWRALALTNASMLFNMPLGEVAWGVMDALAAMLLGMIAYRLGLLQGRWSTRDTLVLMIGSFAVALPVNAFETWTIMADGFSVRAYVAHRTSYDVGRVALALGWLGVALLACRASWLMWLRSGLAAVGRMALTNYLAQSLMAAVVFVGLGLYGLLSRAELYVVVAGMWLLNVAFSLLWLRWLAMGPVEWVWRAGTYGRWPRLRRAGAPASARA